MPLVGRGRVPHGTRHNPHGTRPTRDAYLSLHRRMQPTHKTHVGLSAEDTRPTRDACVRPLLSTRQSRPTKDGCARSSSSQAPRGQNRHAKRDACAGSAQADLHANSPLCVDITNSSARTCHRRPWRPQRRRKRAGNASRALRGAIAPRSCKGRRTNGGKANKKCRTAPGGYFPQPLGRAPRELSPSFWR